MKFLIITPILNTEIGGMERFVIEISNSLTKLDHNVTILTSKKGTPIHIEGTKIIRKKIEFPRFLNKFIKYLQLSNYAKKHLERNNYDAVIAMGFSGILLNNFIWRASGSPIPLTSQIRLKTSRNFLSKIYLWVDIKTQQIMEKRCIKKSKAQMFPSIYMKSQFEKYYNFKSKNWFIPCSAFGINEVKNQTKKNDLWRKLKNYKKILIVNSLSESRKGKLAIYKLIKNSKLENIKFIVLGKVNQSLKRKLMNKNAIFIGQVKSDQIPEFYKNCDLLLFTSLYEGFPNTILEAASFGLPIISNKILGIEEYFKENSEIIYVKDLSFESLNTTLRKSIKSKNFLKNLSKNLSKKSRKLSYGEFTKEFIGFIKNDLKEKSMLSN